MAQGMNWGIFSLLGVVVLVLASIASFFVYLAKRASFVPARKRTGSGSAKREMSVMM